MKIKATRCHQIKKVYKSLYWLNKTNMCIKLKRLLRKYTCKKGHSRLLNSIHISLMRIYMHAQVTDSESDYKLIVTDTQSFKSFYLIPSLYRLFSTRYTSFIVNILLLLLRRPRDKLALLTLDSFVLEIWHATATQKIYEGFFLGFFQDLICKSLF